MSDFKAKKHQIQFRLGRSPRPRCGSLQRSPRPSSWIKGSLLLRGRGLKRGLKGERGRGQGNGRGMGVERERVGEGKSSSPQCSLAVDALCLNTLYRTLNKHSVLKQTYLIDNHSLTHSLTHSLIDNKKIN